MNPPEAVLSLQPVLQSIHEHRPAVQITLLISDVIKDKISSYLDVFSDIELISVAEWNMSDLAALSHIFQQSGKQFIELIRSYSFDAAIVFTTPDQSPYAWAYLCYLSAIPIRLGYSREFGGCVLSHWIQLPLDALSLSDYYLYLLVAAGFIPETVKRLESIHTALLITK
jgi:ADP-heptose:LPS heptosyltransferase